MNPNIKTALWAVGSAVSAAVVDALVAQLQGGSVDVKRIGMVALVTALITVRAFLAKSPKE